MPRIFDNIEQQLLPALRETIELSQRSDFCVGFFNLRGWKQIDADIEKWNGGEGNCCRLLVGMQKLESDELRDALSVAKRENTLDNQTAIKLKKKLAEEFRDQLALGIPTNEDESGLRRLARQIKNKKVVVKLFLRHPLHAKLYLLFRSDPINPIIGFLGSSNLTLAGLSHQGELNVDVLDHDATQKLARWFDDRWNDRWCLDISDELVEIIEESWAREELIPPYHIYIKMAYHLSQEARAGLSEFKIPKDFGNKLFEFQTAAVKIAAHHLNKRGGVLIGDVVGLGKTLMATALARIMEDDNDWETLIICPKNLVSMWEDYRSQYRLRAKVLSISQVVNELPALRRYRLLLIDESHNLRNREGKRYQFLREYIKKNESKCILLSATPYNKTYFDLANQLRLFIPDDKDLGIRPDQYINKMLNGSETEFIRKHQCSVRSIAAFEKSIEVDDWRELMRLYMVRRTRSFILHNYAEPKDPATERKYLTFEDGTKSYFPTRLPKTIKFKIDDADPDDQYAKLYSLDVVSTINSLNVPRYGLGNYITPTPHEPPTQAEAKILDDLSRAGKRLMGFCRTNLFKRLESSGSAFLQSIERHILRNYIFLYALEHGKPFPIGTQDAGLLDTRISDVDADQGTGSMFEDDNDDETNNSMASLRTEEALRKKAEEVYNEYERVYKTRFKWLRSDLFVSQLPADLTNDSQSLLNTLNKSGEWKPEKDEKLEALCDLLLRKHPNEKVLIFTQFADTVHYLEERLRLRGLTKMAGVTGDSSDPTLLAWRFSPVSNHRTTTVNQENELRVLIATDVLSEGQNLQDCNVVVNYDLPWAIIRLVQRAGRVDRIGQKAENIFCYSFLPADGVERIIRLRARVRHRLKENAEVVGTDEAFFEDDRNEQSIRDLFTEKSGILDGEADDEVDLASYAYQIWKNAVTKEPKLQKSIPDMPPVVYSTKQFDATGKEPGGVLVYMRTAEGNDALAWVDSTGKNVTQSQLTILKAAECSPEEPALHRAENHHQLVQHAVEYVIEEEKSVGGALGRPSGARFKTYERLKHYAEKIQGSLFDSLELRKAIEDVHRFPLQQSATDTLNRQLRSGISDESLATLVVMLRDEVRLCITAKEDETNEPRIICSMGLKSE
ncbi:MAG: NgoFVII family restriction endonuclease [Ignavibacteriae bacterium]|nr:NgoFVII family restriction endonuclease [Ignavibacteriota bacterium]